jgi:uncharacterized protein (TIGR03663 family)
MVQVEERVQRAPARREAPAAPPPEAPVVRDWSWWPFAAITAVALLLRMWDLGARAMHHDESLHALYSWYLYVGRPYVHDPMMHGPFLFHFTALLYLIFGDSEVTARLPMVLLGTASVFMPFFLRHELGRFGAIAASLMLAFGPAFFYFSRFGHNEAMLVFQTLLVVVGLFGWLRTRRSPYLYAAAVGIALMFATKIVSLIFGFTVAAFILGAVVAQSRRTLLEDTVLDAIRDIGWRRLGICVAIFFAISGLLYTTFLTNLEGLCTALWSPPVGSCTGKLGMLQYWQAQQGEARGSQPWFYYLMLIPLYEIVPLTLALFAPFLARRPRSLFFWFAVWWAVSAILIYSLAGEKMPWLIVHPTLPLVILGALTVEGVMNRARLPWILASRQWAVAGLALLGAAVFVAWVSAGATGDGTQLASQTGVLRRAALAVVLAGVVAFAVWVGSKLSWRQAAAAIGTAVLAVMIVYSIRTGWQVTYKNGDVPVDMLVYVQSSPDVPFIVEEVERVGNTLGLRKEVPILLDTGRPQTSGEAVSWPFEWYFRDYKAKTYFSGSLPADFSTGKYAAILVMGVNLDPIRDQLAGYTGNKFRLNWWYPEDYKQLASSTKSPAEGFVQTLVDPDTRRKFFGTIWFTLTDATAREKVAKYVVHRELVNPPLGARDMYFYVRDDLAKPGRAAPAMPREVPQVSQPPRVEPAADVAVQNSMVYRGPGPTVMRDPKGVALDSEGRMYVVDGANSTVTLLNRDGTVVRSWGRKGEGEGEFNEPWGIAVAPDGSVFVADTWNHRIQKFTREGQFIAQWGGHETGTTPGRFYGPRDVAISPAGELLVTDTGNKRIQVFNQQGMFLRAFGTEGGAPGQFREPVGLAVDGSGRIYVADTWNQRIQVFDASFNPLAQHAVPGWVGSGVTNKPYIAVTANGDVFATVPERAGVVRVKDGVTSQLPLPQNPRLVIPTGIDIDGSGRLVVADAQAGVVVGFDVISAAVDDMRETAVGAED